MIANEKNSLLDAPPEMVELALLVPSWQVEVLERLAAEEGLTIGPYLRRLVNRAIAEHE